MNVRNVVTRCSYIRWKRQLVRLNVGAGRLKPSTGLIGTKSMNMSRQIEGNRIVLLHAVFEIITVTCYVIGNILGDRRPVGPMNRDAAVVGLIK